MLSWQVWRHAILRVAAATEESLEAQIIKLFFTQVGMVFDKDLNKVRFVCPSEYVYKSFSPYSMRFYYELKNLLGTNDLGFSLEVVSSREFLLLQENGTIPSQETLSSISLEQAPDEVVGDSVFPTTACIALENSSNNESLTMGTESSVAHDDARPKNKPKTKASSVVKPTSTPKSQKTTKTTKTKKKDTTCVKNSASLESNNVSTQDVGAKELNTPDFTRLFNIKPKSRALFSTPEGSILFDPSAKDTKTGEAAELFKKYHNSTIFTSKAKFEAQAKLLQERSYQEQKAEVLEDRVCEQSQFKQSTKAGNQTSLKTSRALDNKAFGVSSYGSNNTQASSATSAQEGASYFNTFNANGGFKKGALNTPSVEDDKQDKKTKSRTKVSKLSKEQAKLAASYFDFYIKSCKDCLKKSKTYGVVMDKLKPVYPPENLSDNSKGKAKYGEWVNKSRMPLDPFGRPISLYELAARNMCMAEVINNSELRYNKISELPITDFTNGRHRVITDNMSIYELCLLATDLSYLSGIPLNRLFVSGKRDDVLRYINQFRFTDDKIHPFVPESRFNTGFKYGISDLMLARAKKDPAILPYVLEKLDYSKINYKLDHQDSLGLNLPQRPDEKSLLLKLKPHHLLDSEFFSENSELVDNTEVINVDMNKLSALAAQNEAKLAEIYRQALIKVKNSKPEKSVVYHIPRYYEIIPLETLERYSFSFLKDKSNYELKRLTLYPKLKNGKVDYSHPIECVQILPPAGVSLTTYKQSMQSALDFLKDNASAKFMERLDRNLEKNKEFKQEKAAKAKAKQNKLKLKAQDDLKLDTSAISNDATVKPVKQTEFTVVEQDISSNISAKAETCTHSNEFKVVEPEVAPKTAKDPLPESQPSSKSNNYLEKDESKALDRIHMPDFACAVNGVVNDPWLKPGQVAMANPWEQAGATSKALLERFNNRNLASSQNNDNATCNSKSAGNDSSRKIRVYRPNDSLFSVNNKHHLEIPVEQGSAKALAMIYAQKAQEDAQNGDKTGYPYNYGKNLPPATEVVDNNKPQENGVEFTDFIPNNADKIKSKAANSHNTTVASKPRSKPRLPYHELMPIIVDGMILDINDKAIYEGHLDSDYAKETIAARSHSHDPWKAPLSLTNADGSVVPLPKEKQQSQELGVRRQAFENKPGALSHVLNNGEQVRSVHNNIPAANEIYYNEYDPELAYAAKTYTSPALNVGSGDHGVLTLFGKDACDYLAYQAKHQKEQQQLIEEAFDKGISPYDIYDRPETIASKLEFIRAQNKLEAQKEQQAAQQKQQAALKAQQDSQKDQVATKNEQQAVQNRVVDYDALKAQELKVSVISFHDGLGDNDELNPLWDATPHIPKFSSSSPKRIYIDDFNSIDTRSLDERLDEELFGDWSTNNKAHKVYPEIYSTNNGYYKKPCHVLTEQERQEFSKRAIENSRWFNLVQSELENLDKEINSVVCANNEFTNPAQAPAPAQIQAQAMDQAQAPAKEQAQAQEPSFVEVQPQAPAQEQVKAQEASFVEMQSQAPAQGQAQAQEPSFVEVQPQAPAQEQVKAQEASFVEVQPYAQEQGTAIEVETESYSVSDIALQDYCAGQPYEQSVEQTYTPIQEPVAVCEPSNNVYPQQDMALSEYYVEDCIWYDEVDSYLDVLAISSVPAAVEFADYIYIDRTDNLLEDEVLDDLIDYPSALCGRGWEYFEVETRVINTSTQLYYVDACNDAYSNIEGGKPWFAAFESMALRDEFCLANDCDPEELQEYIFELEPSTFNHDTAHGYDVDSNYSMSADEMYREQDMIDFALYDEFDQLEAWENESVLEQLALINQQNGYQAPMDMGMPQAMDNGYQSFNPMPQAMRAPAPVPVPEQVSALAPVNNCVPVPTSAVASAQAPAPAPVTVSAQVPVRAPVYAPVPEFNNVAYPMDMRVPQGMDYGYQALNPMPQSMSAQGVAPAPVSAPEVPAAPVNTCAPVPTSTLAPAQTPNRVPVATPATFAAPAPAVPAQAAPVPAAPASVAVPAPAVPGNVPARAPVYAPMPEVDDMSYPMAWDEEQENGLYMDSARGEDYFDSTPWSAAMPEPFMATNTVSAGQIAASSERMIEPIKDVHNLNMNLNSMDHGANMPQQGVVAQGYINQAFGSANTPVFDPNNVLREASVKTSPRGMDELKAAQALEALEQERLAQLHMGDAFDNKEIDKRNAQAVQNVIEQAYANQNLKSGLSSLPLPSSFLNKVSNTSHVGEHDKVVGLNSSKQAFNNNGQFAKGPSVLMQLAQGKPMSQCMPNNINQFGEYDPTPMLEEVPLPPEMIANMSPAQRRAYEDYSSLCPSKEVNPSKTFASYIIEPTCSKLVHAVYDLCNTITTPGYKCPMFIHGPSGVGKTHLLSAMVNKVKAEHPHLKVAYVRSEDFIRQYVASIADMQKTRFSDRQVYFQQAFTDHDLLIFDDIQSLVKGEKSRKVFFDIVDDFLTKPSAQLVLAADVPVSALTAMGFSDDLTSRINSGITIELKTPGHCARRDIIKAKCDELGMTMCAEILEFMALNISANVRDIEGALRTIHAMMKDQNSSLTFDEVVRNINNFIVARNTVVPLDSVLALVSAEFKVSNEEMFSPSKKKLISQARSVACCLARDFLPELSLNDLAKVFKKDHSSIHEAILRTRERLVSDYELKARVQRIVASVNKLIESSD
ncbi:DnaA/Hda family protein [Anaerobiospirillum sp. NML120448]|uniref:DnaA ATPase domain-containing protein n=1 Tax=Anaerobiospirillum sp. NML120448 TaxID=2932816 RepID=UPI001FF24095|nr:DnaA/Hda family protein [Anaerobiospirillum sp. NML120448]MCK0514320.1 DnaA/Hda family protein [Anaerobiospirillum sp. NML120448]